MENLKIKIPKGYEIDKEKTNIKTGEIVCKKIKNVLPKKWKDIGRMDGYYIDGASDIYSCHKELALDYNRNVLPTKELAKAMLCLCQLLYLRDIYRQGWKPNWNNTNECKYTITYYSNKLCVYSSFTIQQGALSFQKISVATQFIDNFKDLLIEARELI